MPQETKPNKDATTTVYATYRVDGRKRREVFKVLPEGTSKRKLTRAQDRAVAFAHEQRCAVKSGEWRGTKQDRERLCKDATLALALPAFVKSRGDLQYWKNGEIPFGRFFAKHRKQVTTLASLTRADAEAYRAHRHKKVGPSTLRKDLLFARALFKWARKRKLVPADCDPFDEVRIPKEPASRVYELTYEEQARLREAILKTRRATRAVERQAWLLRVFDWLVGTGMDRSEVCKLKWTAVNEVTGKITAPRGKTGVVRYVKITDPLRVILDDCRKLKNTSGLVFLDDDGQPIKPGRISLALRRAYARAGVPIPKGRPVKILRHIFGTQHYRACKDPLLTQRAMGHKKLSQTAIYMHVCDEDSSRAADAMAKATSEAMQALASGGAA